MLERLYVKNLALIDEIEVEFHPGLNILTGETGAGKSILLDSVNLALGGRYSAEMLRSGAAFGFVELTFSVERPELQHSLEEMEVFPEDGHIVLSRRLMEGRSISRINGETVSMGVLKNVAGLLLDIHGQHEHQFLLQKKNHLSFLDLYAAEEVSRLKEETARAYHDYRMCRQKLEESVLDERERQRELSLAEFETQEIEQAGLFQGEDEELEQLYRRMCAGKQAAESIAGAYRYTGGNASGSASDFLSRAIRALEDVKEADQKGSELYGQLLEIDSLLNDFNRELSEYAGSWEFSEEEFHETENRLNEVNRLKAKYGNSVKDILEYCKQKKQRLMELEDYEAYLDQLKENLKTAQREYEHWALELRRVRKKAAVPFVEEIRNNLKELHFLDVKFEIHFSEIETPSAGGMDEAEFFISTNPGEPLKPLGMTASGGELSRVMLAVRTVLADREKIPTLIFDEIDTGISGITAGKVAEKMARIARSRQVICITHLAQIAARADTHYRIQKEAEENVTRTTVSVLEEEASVRELARLLGGEAITPAVLQSAREMKRSGKAQMISENF